MLKKVMVIAPHPDDETLGCGGTLMRHKQQGDEIYWVIVTSVSESGGFSKDKIRSRQEEIEAVSQIYEFTETFQLGYQTTCLDTVPMKDLVNSISEIVQNVKPQIMYLPYRGDVHSDHAVVYDASISCTKWFRYPSVERVLVYETLSETDFNTNPDTNGFRPNVFVNISEFLSKKLGIMGIFKSEMGEFPFPRSEQAIEASASLRGAASGVKAAEAFMLIKEITYS